MGEISDKEWLDRFHKKVGQLICRSPAAAVMARHRNPLATIRDYFDLGENNGTPEWQAQLFVREFSHLCTSFDKREELPKFIERWPVP